uniref:PAP-associated domain-containing protein n=1 Tax=Strongyloides papillosus TaxID=174720 RepID=A0A0N5B475_STREA
MSFLYRKHDLFSTIKNVIVRFLKSDIHAYNKSKKNTSNSVYECAILNYYHKLQCLEEKLETADKIRANAHKTLIKKSAEKIDLLKKTICTKESDLLIVGPAATGLTISKDFDVFVVFVLPNDESNDFLKNLKKMKCKHIEKTGKLIKANKKLWNEKKDKLSHNFNASIPKTKLNFGDGTRITIKFSCHNSLKNTNLIRYYTASDPRYRKVYMYIKNLASKLKIIDANNGLLSGYQILVLVAHFLQRSLKDQQPVFPVIPQVCSSFVSPNLPLKEVVKNLKEPVDVSGIQCLINSKPLASHLAIQFIDYFANFDFLSKAIFLDKIDPVEMLQVDSPPKLQIFDPYSDESISKGYCASEAFSESMKYVQNLIKEGYCIDDFSNLPGLDDFKKKFSKSSHMQSKS